jgi:hypothetical protein
VPISAGWGLPHGSTLTPKSRVRQVRLHASHAPGPPANSKRTPGPAGARLLVWRITTFYFARGQHQTPGGARGISSRQPPAHPPDNQHREARMSPGRLGSSQPAVNNADVNARATRRHKGVMISADQRIRGGWHSHGGAEARRKQREEPTTRHKGNWRVPWSCLCVETPVVADGRRVFCTAPGINPVRVHKYIPGRQANAVWGRCPTACAMYVIEVYWGLVDKISPAFEFEKLGWHAGSR